MQAAKVDVKNPYTEFLDVLASVLRRSGTDVPLGLIVVRIGEFWRLVTSMGYHEARQTMFELEAGLRAGLRQRDILMRLADGKFGVIIPGVLNEGHLTLAANKVTRLVHESSQMSCRMGMALSPAHATEADALLRAAETALLAAEDDGNEHRLYDVTVTEHVNDRWVMELELDDALANNGLDVNYQPKVTAGGHQTIGAEALVRWHSATRGFVSPEVFVSLADETGRIDQLTWYVLNIATRTCMEWPRRSPPLTIAVNVTPNVVETYDLPRLVSNALGLWNLPPELLVIELTESALMNNPDETGAVLKELRSGGIKVAIDDFGTGYSSLSYFRDIPADELKIDKSFVFKMLDDDATQRLVRTIINLAHDFGLTVTAEGVENEETAALLAELQCDHLQGFFFSRPLPNADFINWLDT